MNPTPDEPRYPEVVVPLTSGDGNAGTIMGSVSRALRKAGASEEEIAQYRVDSMSGDYDNLLRTAMEWVSVE